MPDTHVTVYRWLIVANADRCTPSPLYATREAIRVLFESTLIPESALRVSASDVDAIGFYAPPPRATLAATG